MIYDKTYMILVSSPFMHRFVYYAVKRCFPYLYQYYLSFYIDYWEGVLFFTLKCTFIIFFIGCSFDIFIEYKL